MRANVWTVSLMSAVLLTHSGGVLAQATANAVVGAEDAFGSSEGDESVGIYDQTSVRGFNLEAAGNYRIDGRYFVKNSGVSSFFVERTTIWIGYNALSLDFAGPSGVVDYKLRDPQRGEPSQATIGLDPRSPRCRSMIPMASRSRRTKSRPFAGGSRTRTSPSSPAASKAIRSAEPSPSPRLIL